MRLSLRLLRKKSSSSKRWSERQRSDPFVKSRHAEKQYVSRASYKLEWILDKDAVLRDQCTVVDLGAAPGSWAQVLFNRFKHCHYIGCDLLPHSLPNPIPDQFHWVQGDFTDPLVVQKIKQLVGSRRLDAVLCDAHHNTTGDKQADHFLLIGLAEQALEFAKQTLEPGGSFVVKVNRGGEENEFRGSVASHFKRAVFRKPDASRSDSREIYVVATNFKGTKT